MATSASRLAISTPSSPAAATPVVISTAPANRRRNASSSGAATNSANVEVATTRSCSGAPWAARTAACASAPSTTIWDAVPSSRVPPGVSVMPAWLRVISWSPRSWRSAVIACETADSLTPSAAAAARTDPSRATSTNAFSCVRVIAHSTVGISASGKPTVSPYTQNVRHQTRDLILLIAPARRTLKAAATDQGPARRTARAAPGPRS